MDLGTRLQILQNKLVQQITSHTDIDLSLPGKEKCAYFCITSDQDSTFDMLATLFTSFLIIKLVRLADRTEERVLPVPVSFILDEFPNIGVVPDFKKKLATARSRRIGMSILFQIIHSFRTVTRTISGRKFLEAVISPFFLAVMT